MYEGIRTGTQYLEFVRNMIYNLLDDLPILVTRDEYFQQDIATAYNSCQVADYLKTCSNSKSLD